MVKASEVGALLRKEIPQFDEDTHEYFTGLICDINAVDEQALREYLLPFLEAYEICADKSGENMVVNNVLSGLRDMGLEDANEEETEATILDKVIVMDRKLAGAKNEQKAALEAMWGFEKVRNLRNELIESTEAGSRKYERQAAKEQKRWLKDLDAQQDGPTEEEMEAQISAMMLPDLSGKSRERDILVDGFNIVFGGQLLLEEAQLRIVYGRRYGLIGRNGVGKTTLLRHMAAFDIPGFPKHHRILHVKQEVHSNEVSVLNTVLSSDVERNTLLAKEKDLLALQESDDAMAASGRDSEEVQSALAAVYERMDMIGAHDAEVRAQRILDGLQFTKDMQSSSTNDLSGGWRMRVALASALFIEPDLLMLDEPTNHLDLEAVLWLQDYLQSYPHTVLVVSHDRAFLNEVCTDVIQFEKKKLNYYRGNYDVYLGTRKEQLQLQQRLHEARKAKVDHMQEFVDRFRFNAKKASLVQSRIKAIEREEVVDAVTEEVNKFNFVFLDPGPLGRPVIQIEGVSFGYSPQKLLFENVHMGIDGSTRIALVGPNGAGKSTLLNLILDKIQPTDGHVLVNPQLRIGVFTQHHMDSFDITRSAVQNMAMKWPLAPDQELRAHLGRFEIHGNDAIKPMKFMSGGQKSRVAFASLTYTKPHVILLDEPTNHLDMEAIEALTTAIKEFKGGVLIISHDQFFIQQVCSQIWVVRRGGVEQFTVNGQKGDFKDYKRECVKAFRKKVAAK